MLAARARAAGTAWRSGLPALTGGAARALCVPVQHIHPEMPDKWRKLSESCAATRPLSPCGALTRLTPGPPVRSLHGPRGVGHGGAQAARGPDAGDGEVAHHPQGHCCGGEPTGAHATHACTVHTSAWTVRGAAARAQPRQWRTVPRSCTTHTWSQFSAPCAPRALDRPAMYVHLPTVLPCTHPVHLHRHRSSRRTAPSTAIDWPRSRGGSIPYTETRGGRGDLLASGVTSWRDTRYGCATLRS